MKSCLIIVCLGVAACGGTTNGAQCASGTTLVNGQCVVTGGGAGGGAEVEAGVVGDQDSSVADSSGGSMTGAAQVTWVSNWISGTTNPVGIEGWIWSANDCELATSAGLPCNQPDPTLIGPDQKPGWSISDQGLCLKGTTEAVTDWSKQWGVDLGINLTADGKTPYDASKLKGFLFDITGTAPATITIGLKMPKVTQSHSRTVQVPSTDARVVFAGPDAVAQNASVTGADKVPFDPTQLVFITFVPPAQMGVPTPYDFCVRTFRVLQ